MRRIVIMGLLIGVLLFALTGCSGSNSGNESGDVAEAAVNNTTAPEITLEPTATIAPTETPIPEPTATEVIDLNEPCRLANRDSGAPLSMGFPLPSARLRASGQVSAAVLFVDFSNAPATRSPESMLGLVSPQAEEYFSAVSYGAFDLSLVPHLTWLRMSKPSTDYDYFTFESHQDYIEEAVALADDDFDFTGIEEIIVLTTTNATSLYYGPTFVGDPKYGGIRTDEGKIYNAVTSGSDLLNWGYLWLNHEMGHSLGLEDLYAFSGNSNYVGAYDLMGDIGGVAPEYSAYHRWLLGWLDDQQIVCQVDGEQTSVISAVEIPDGEKVVIVPISKSKAIVIESRRALGYDHKLVKPGVLVYLINTRSGTGNGPMIVQPDDNTNRHYATLALGESMEIEGVTIEVLEATDTTDMIRVTVSD